MRYMLMMNAPRKGWESLAGWPPEDFKAHIAFMLQLNKDLTASGELVSAEGLDMPAEARIVTATKGGPAVTDGPFPETKEFLAGFWIVDVESTERAVAIAGRVSSAPGPGGQSLNIPVELRQVMCGPPPLDEADASR